MSSISAHIRDGAGSGVGHGSLRLTRRGRLLVFVVAAALAALASVLVAGSVLATDEPTEMRTVQVEPGATLWSIAADADPGGDTGSTVHEIADLNEITSTGSLQVGQVLAVPVY